MRRSTRSGPFPDIKLIGIREEIPLQPKTAPAVLRHRRGQREFAEIQSVRGLHQLGDRGHAAVFQLLKDFGQGIPFLEGEPDRLGPRRLGGDRRRGRGRGRGRRGRRRRTGRLRRRRCGAGSGDRLRIGGWLPRQSDIGGGRWQALRFPIRPEMESCGSPPPKPAAAPPCLPNNVSSASPFPCRCFPNSCRVPDL